MWLILLFSLFSSFAYAKPKTTVIAIIDTGFGMTEVSKKTKFLCKYGHKDFSGENIFVSKIDTIDPVPFDNNGHGTNIAGTIVSYASQSKKPFCLVIIKYYTPKKDNSERSLNAIAYARKLKVDIINYSGGGELPDRRETKEVKDYLDGGGIFVAAAGNENKDLAKTPYYPACSDDRVIVVGNLSKDLKISALSNYGMRVNRWEYGENVNSFDITMTGTSQATAVATGKLLSENNKNMIQARKELAIRK